MQVLANGGQVAILGSLNELRLRIVESVPKTIRVMHRVRNATIVQENSQRTLDLESGQSIVLGKVFATGDFEVSIDIYDEDGGHQHECFAIQAVVAEAQELEL